MRWSWRIVRIAGIDVFLHWTFLLLLVWLVVSHATAGASAPEIAEGVGLVLAVFACVVFHELGHALTARRYGIPTRDITLLPIGGVARLERIPEEPRQELLIAIAGPAVNVAIAAILLVVISLIDRVGRVYEIDPENLAGTSFFVNLLWFNVAMVLFNLLPAFPMDGGRVLRAMLATRMSRVRATHIASVVGQGMAILFGAAGILLPNWALLFIAIFVYLGAAAEAQAVEMRAILGGVAVRDAMATRFVTLTAGDPLERAIDELLAGHQQDFPVVDGDRVLGIIFRKDLFAALKKGPAGLTVGDVMSTDCRSVNANDRLDKTVTDMQSSGCSSLLVTDKGRLMGLLTSENIGEWTMIQSALRERKEIFSQ
jgi:Zn-dependent protease/CBS domain-containing protein